VSDHVTSGHSVRRCYGRAGVASNGNLLLQHLVMLLPHPEQNVLSNHVGHVFNLSLYAHTHGRAVKYQYLNNT